MRSHRADPLLTLVQSFFASHLRRVRGASEHTVRAYRDTLRLFFLFLSEHVGRSVADLRLNDIHAEAVLAFLQYIESSRGSCATTRNCRLAALRSFADHLLRHDVTRAEQYGRILAIPRKRASQPDEPVFRNARGAPLTRDGVAYVITKHVRRAAEGRPVLRRRRVTPHVLRHSCAVALLQAGVDVSVIRDYLGHASITTTSRYIATNLEMKRVVLEAFWARAGLDRRSAAGWRPSPKLLAYLASL